MAFVKLGHIKESKTGSKSEGLKYCLEYIFNEKKTEGKYIGSHNLYINYIEPAKCSYEQMMDTKQFFDKYEGRQGYHFKLSFPPYEDVSPELALKITEDFINRYIPGYEVAYAVHTDRPHLHSHFVFNSIHYETGLKYHYKKGEWAKYIQPVANEVCKKYGISGLDLCMDKEYIYSHRNKDYGTWKKQNPDKVAGEPEKYTNAMILCDIKECINKAKTYEEFKMLLKERGHIYNDNPNHKYITIKAPRREKFCRIINLTPDKQTYTKENIIKMIAGTYKGLTPEESKARLVEDMKKYFAGRYTINDFTFSKAKITSVVEFSEQHGLKTKEDIKEYMIYLDSSKGILSELRKNILMKINPYEVAVKDMYEMLQMFKFYIYYKKGQEKYKIEHDKVLEIYSSLKDRGYNIPELYKFNKQCKNMLNTIDEYQKHVFVEKKICERLVKQEKQIKEK